MLIKKMLTSMAILSLIVINTGLWYFIYNEYFIKEDNQQFAERLVEQPEEIVQVAHEQQPSPSPATYEHVVEEINTHLQTIDTEWNEMMTASKSQHEATIAKTNDLMKSFEDIFNKAMSVQVPPHQKEEHEQLLTQLYEHFGSMMADIEKLEYQSIPFSQLQVRHTH